MGNLFLEIGWYQNTYTHRWKICPTDPGAFLLGITVLLMSLTVLAWNNIYELLNKPNTIRTIYLLQYNKKLFA